MFDSVYARLGTMVRAFLLGCLVLLACGTEAFAATYVSDAFPPLTPEQIVKVAQPRPVQVIFEFRTKGGPNPRATKVVMPWVRESLIASGLFSSVDDTPNADGALLTVVINNVYEPGAAGKGFVTGLTFGLKGSLVTDLYDCTFEYLPNATSVKITHTLRHALITSVGIAGAPEHAVKAANANDGAKEMVTQAVAHGVNTLAADPGFLGVRATPPVDQPAASPPAATSPTS